MCKSESLKMVVVDGNQKDNVNHESASQSVFSPLTADPEDIRAWYLKNRLKIFITRLVGSFSKEGQK